MTENLSKLPSGHRKTEKSVHRMVAEKILFPRRWYGGMISTKLEAIWEMSVKSFPVGLLHRSGEGARRTGPRLQANLQHQELRGRPAPRCRRAAIAAHKINPCVTAITDSFANKRTVLGVKHRADLLSASVGR